MRNEISDTELKGDGASAAIDSEPGSANFNYNYSALRADEKRWIESIRREYLPEERNDKVAQLKSLHKKAKTLPTYIAASVGVIGALVLGTGMALSLEWNSLVGGIIVGFIGMAIMLFAYPLHQLLRDKGKKKYGDKIIKLTDELSVDVPEKPTNKEHKKTDE